MDNLKTGRLRRLPPEVNFHHADVSSAAVDEIFIREKPNVVFHLAAQISVRDSIRNPVPDAEANILGTLRLMHAARRHGVEKLVFSSTGGALYGNPDTLPCREDHPIRPLSPYGLGKSVGEMYLELYRQTYRLNYAALRYGNVYGPRQDPQGEAGVIAIFCMAILENKQPRIFGGGEQQRDFVYVKDVVDANILALNDEVVGPYNIGSGVGTSINQIYAMLGKVLRYRKKAVHSPARLGDVHRIILDSTKAGRDMGWQPKTGLAEGLELTAAYFRGALRRTPA